MNLLEKFDAVEVKADRRIAPEDRSWCAAQHAAYLAAGDSFAAIEDLIREEYGIQKNFLARHYGSNYSSSDSYLGTHFNDGDARQWNMDRHQKYIMRVVNYFANKYRVHLDAYAVKDRLIPPPPDEPRYYGIISRDEQYFAELEVYKKKKEEYEKSLCKLDISYETILDEIFQQLGGFSFSEKAEAELKKKLYDEFHRKDWRTGGVMLEQFEVKNKTLKLDYGCSPYYSYSSSADLQLTSSGKALICGLCHWEFGDEGRAASAYRDIMDYRFSLQKFQPDSEKVEEMRFFKNHRVDIRFTDAATCNDFVDRYLRTEITEV